MLRRENWAIVGGGMLGLTLAHRLAGQGQSVTVFESAPELGGLASCWQLGDVVWDRHYHVILLSDSYLRRLLAEIGLEGEIQWRETRTGFYTDGALHSMSNTLDFLRFPPLSLLGKLRLGLTILRASRYRDGKKLEDILVSDWLQRWSGRVTFEKIWLPLLRAKLGDSYRITSAAFIWATIRRMYAARRTGLKKEMFGYVPGGYARIVDTLSTTLREKGVTLRTGQQVQHVSTPDQRYVDLALRGGQQYRFDKVVLTLPGPLVAQLCPQLNRAEAESWSRIQYLGIVCASLLLDKPLAGFYVTNITETWVPFTAVIEMSALVDACEFRGRSLVYLPKYVTSDDPVFRQSEDDVRHSFLDALGRMYPDFRQDDVLAWRTSRVRHVMAIPTLRYSRYLPSMVTSLPGVHVVNSAHIVNGTLNVNETVRLAEQAICDILLSGNSAHTGGTHANC